MHHLGHLARSVLEGVPLNVREILEVRRQAGPRRERIVTSGGATTEELWLQTLADVVGRETVTVTGTAEGGALAAGVGTGQWRNLEEALDVLAVERTIVPEQRAVETYDKVFTRHRTLYAGLRPLFAE